MQERYCVEGKIDPTIGNLNMQKAIVLDNLLIMS